MVAIAVTHGSNAARQLARVDEFITACDRIGFEPMLLAERGLGNAVLFSIAQAFRAAGSRVLYFAGYRNIADRYKVADIEAAADEIGRAHV